MKEPANDFLYGALFGLFVLAMLNGCIPTTDAHKYRVAKEECEKTLPRNEHCIVIGVPIDKN